MKGIESGRHFDRNRTQLRLMDKIRQTFQLEWEKVEKKRDMIRRSFREEWEKAENEREIIRQEEQAIRDSNRKKSEAFSQAIIYFYQTIRSTNQYYSLCCLCKLYCSIR